MKNKVCRWRILLVEDDPALGAATTEVLNHFGHLVDWSHSANEAFESLSKKNDFDVVLLDLGLGSRDGVSLVMALKANGYSLPPILVLSSQPIGLLRRAATDTSAVAILQKPCSAERLNAALNSVLGASP